MAALAEHPAVIPSSTDPMPSVNAAYDHDIDSFINLDQLAYSSTDPVRPKPALASQPSVSSSDFNSNDAKSASFTSNTSQSPMAFQAPSHQYDEHKQQTGLPPGALAQAMPFNHVNGMGFGGNQGFAMNNDMFQHSQVKAEDASLDFNTVPARNPSEMDMETDNMGSVPTYFVPQNSNKSQFVDPNALGAQEVVPANPSTQVGRMYPGMHQQQAAMAKAAQQQKHHEFLRQQQVQQDPGSQPQQHLNSARSLRHPDPVVEERISRLLQQMRQNALASSGDSPTPSLPQMAKIRKEEQDMDEDERLLASEEGKKLSSKERRQLRNKVSARAFRSRRKEYIGQLESEVAARTTESHELRLQNRALYDENAHLTDLARMLLSSPHFSTFLDDMNASGGSFPAPNQQPAQQAPQQQPPPLPSQPQQPSAPQQPMQTNAPKDVNPNPGPQEFSMQQNPETGMVMVPNQGIDVSAMGMNNAGWNSGIDMNYGNTPVFAVLDVPRPTFEPEILSGKSSSVDSYLPETPKESIPPFECPQFEESNGDAPASPEPEIELDESERDPLFDAPVASPPPSSVETVKPEKESPAFELVVETEAKAAAIRLKHLCQNMEGPFQRILRATSHLS